MARRPAAIAPDRWAKAYADAFDGDPTPPPETTAEGDSGENSKAFATGYANGEAVDVPVTPPAEPGELFPPLREPEMHDGREVTRHEVRFGGKAGVGRVMEPDVTFWKTLVGGRRGYARVAFTVGDDGHDSGKADYTYYRKVKVDAIHLDGSGIFDETTGAAVNDAYDELEEAREEAAGYHETIIDWVAAARLVAEAFELADDELGDLVRGIAAYGLPGEEVVTADASDPGTSTDVEESEEPSMLTAALAEALS